MPISSNFEPNNHELRVAIDGKFDFNLHQEFRNAYERTDINFNKVILDMESATYLDSSALGMLLLLRDFAHQRAYDLRIVNCNTDIKKIFTIANFDKLFDIA